MNIRRFLLFLVPSVLIFGSPAFAGNYTVVPVSGGSDPFASRKWDERMMPINWQFSLHGYHGSSLSNSEIVNEISTAFQNWENIETSNVSFTYGGEVDARLTRGDGTNLITFTDPSVEFGPGVLGLAFTYTFTQETVITDSNNDIDGDGVADLPNGTYAPGTIYDADIVFNSARDYTINGEEGSYDIQAIALHEIGHFMGLSHSSIESASMYPFLSANIEEARTPASDDLAWISHGYPHTLNFEQFYGVITGTVMSGSHGGPILGAHVYAADPATGEKLFGTYSNEAGEYELPAIAGSYYIGIEPLDGDPAALDPKRINQRIAQASEVFWVEEFFDLNESNIEVDTLAAVPVSVTAGEVSTDVNFITNLASLSGVSRVLDIGANYFSYPVEVPSGLTAFDLLPALGTPSEVSAIERLNPETQLFERASFVNDAPAGVDFPIVRGEGYIVYAQQRKTVTFSGIVDCSEMSLLAGLNLFAAPCLPSNFSAFDLLQYLGSEYEVVSLRRYDNESSSFQVVEYVNGVPSGENFFITSGEAYFVEMLVDKTGLNAPGQGVVFPAQILSISPGRGLEGDLVMIHGENFADDISDNFVRFNGVNAHVIYSSSTLIATRVPYGASSGPITVRVGDRESNGVEFIVDDATIQEDANSASGTSMIAGQTAEGTLDVEQEQDQYTFIGLEGALLDASVLPTDGSVDLLLVLEGPSGAVLAYDDDSGSGNAPRIQHFKLPETGVYTLTVTSVSGSGGYTLSLDILNTATDSGVSVLQGDTQSTLAGAPLAQPIQVYVTSSSGQPLVGAQVTFTASNVDFSGSTQGFAMENAGTMAVTTGINGIATVYATAPNQVGVFDIEVLVPGMEPAIMQVSTLESEVSQVIVSSRAPTCGGTGCPVGEALEEPYTITYLDRGGQPIANVFTDWRVIAGEGSLDNFSPEESSPNRHLTDETGIAQVVHTLGEHLYINGTYIKQPHVVAAVVPGEVEPVIFSPITKAALPYSIEATFGDYLRLTKGTSWLNALQLRVTDRFGNPSEDALINIDNGGLNVLPLWYRDGAPSYLTNREGVWIGAVSAWPETLPNFDEFGLRDSDGLAASYQVGVSQEHAGSVVYDVEFDLGPVMVPETPQGSWGHLGQEFPANPVSFELYRFQRVDSDDNDQTWTNEDFSELQRVPIEGETFRFFFERLDDYDPAADGLAVATVDGTDEVEITSTSSGRFEMSVEFGDVGGFLELKAKPTEVIDIQFEEEDGTPIGEPVAFPLELYDNNVLQLYANPVILRVTLSAEQLAGIDWSSLQILLNGSTVVFDASAPALVPEQMPHAASFFIDGAELAEWPSLELLAAGGFSEVEIWFRPLASQIIDGVNTLTINADATNFEGEVEQLELEELFVRNNDFASGQWDYVEDFNSQADFTIGRTTSLAQTQGLPAGQQKKVGTFRVFNVPVSETSAVEVRLLDADKNPVQTFISESALAQNDYRFVILREDIPDSIAQLGERADFYIEVQTTPQSTGLTRTKLHSAELKDTVIGKMLGQIIQHDTLIQDGSLNLRREDLALQGAGPQLTFIRSYSNSRQSENRDSDLGPGWSHNHEIFAKVVSWASPAGVFGEHLPAWVAGTREGFAPRILTAQALSDLVQLGSPQIPMTISISHGGVFEWIDNAWVGQRGNHGSLTGSITTGFTYRSKDGTTYIFHVEADNLGRYKVASVTDRNGNALTYEYGLEERLTRVTDAAGRYLSFEYSRAQTGKRRLDRVHAIVNPNNIDTSENITLEFDYFVAQSANPDEQASRFDEIGMLQRFTRDNFTERYDYDALTTDNEPNLVLVEDANGHRTRYQYLAAADVPSNFNDYAPGTRDTDIVARVCYPTAGDDCATDFAEFEYDLATVNARIVNDLRGNPTRYVLNNWGNPIRVEEPEGKTTEFEWSIDLGETDNVMRFKRDVSINAEWEYQYDSQGNLTLERDPFDSTIEQTWNQDFSVLEFRSDKNGHELRQVLDSNGNVEQVIQQAFIGDSREVTDVVVTHTYGTVHGLHGLRLSTLDGRQLYTTEYDYDERGNLTEVREPAQNNTQNITYYSYNRRGVKTTHRDANDNLTTYQYDSLDRLTLLTDGELNTTEYRYDAKGNKEWEITTDRYWVGEAQHTRTLSLEFQYDERDRVTDIYRRGNLDDAHPIGGHKEFGYDANSNVTRETDWKGVATTHGYDGLNRRNATINRMEDDMSIVYAWVLDGGLHKTTTDYEGHATEEHFDLLGRLARVEHETVNHSDNTTSDYHREIYYDKKANITRIVDEESKETRFVYDPRDLKIERINHYQDTFYWEYDQNGNNTKTIDEETSESTFVYDGQNRLIEKHLPEQHRWDYTYYPNDMLKTEIDPWGFEYSFVYNRINQRTSVTDPDGIIVESYTKDGNLVYRRDAENRETSSLYGPDARLLLTLDGRGRETRYRYDNNNNVTDTILTWTNGVSGPQEVQTHRTFDALDRVDSLYEAYETPDQRITTFGYDTLGNKIRESQPEGRETRYEYDERYRLKKVITPALTENLATDTLFKYDGVGNVVWTQDRREKRTTTTYDDLHRKDIVTDHLGQTVDYNYDRVGNVTAVTDKRGHTTETTYDDLYRVHEQFINDNAGTRFRLVLNEYDLGNTRDGVRRDRVTDAQSNPVEVTKDFRGNPLVTTLPAANDGSYTTATTTNAYDRSGWLEYSFDAEGYETEYSYFNDGSMASVANDQDETTHFEYDIFGNQARVTKPAGNAQTSTYDARNRLVQVADFQGHLTNFEYDVNSNLRHQRSPAAAATGQTHVEYTYDALNRKRSHIQHKGTTQLVTTFTYDAEGNLTSKRDANEQWFQYTYDDLNRLHFEIMPADDDIVQIEHTYDENNNKNIVTEVKPGGNEVTDYDYDLLDRLVLHRQRGHDVTYGYDNNGNRTRVTSPGGETTYTFDTRNRLKTATAQGSQTATSYTYLQNGWLDRVDHANNTSVDYDYYSDGTTQSITNRSGGTVLSSFAYEYDQNNNRTQQIETQNGFATAQVLTTNYGYDSLDRLENYTELSSDSSVNRTHTFTYFPSYDRATEVVVENGTTVKNRAFSYDDTYWLSSINEQAGSGGEISYSYDNNGNTLAKADATGNGPASTVFAYNKRNQLKSVATGTQGSEESQGNYHYNYKGMRIRHLGSDRGDIEYLCDDDSIIDELQNNTTTRVAHYRYGDRLLSLNNSGEEQFYHYAGLGTTTNLSNAQGESQVAYRTDPFGDITQQEGTSVNRQVFTGHTHDEETGLIYMKARFYDPDTARFLNQDSYLGENGMPPSLHRYLYAYSNPNVFIDVDGYASTAAVLPDLAPRTIPNQPAANDPVDARRINSGRARTLRSPKVSGSILTVGVEVVALGTEAMIANASKNMPASVNNQDIGGEPVPVWSNKSKLSPSEKENLMLSRLEHNADSSKAAEKVALHDSLFRTHESKPGQMLNDQEFFNAISQAENRGGQDSSLVPSLTVEKDIGSGGNRIADGTVAQQGDSANNTSDLEDPNSGWSRNGVPRGFRVPNNGSFTGDILDSTFVPNDPESLGLGLNETIEFRKGFVDFRPWAVGEPYDVPGMTGEHKVDMPLIKAEMARKLGILKPDGTPNASAGAEWFIENELVGHHDPITEKIINVPGKLHGLRYKDRETGEIINYPGVRHTGGAAQHRRRRENNEED